MDYFLDHFLNQAIILREPLLDPQHKGAYRLFNGFLEGDPEIVIEVYGTTLVYFYYGQSALNENNKTAKIVEYLRSKMPWLKSGILKTRQNENDSDRLGTLLFGDSLTNRVVENGVRYALNLRMNRDASLYLDTRNLRIWLTENMHGKQVFNAFAYTGSLGVAAMAGGASRVIQLDLNQHFLNLAKESYTLNGFPIRKSDFIAGDFFVSTGRLRREKTQFDCVLLDPPFFSSTNKGRVDLANSSRDLINKVRPLVRDGGWLVAVNNALFLPGQEFYSILEELCSDGYLSLETLIPVPIDCTGFPKTQVRSLPADPSPFNHATKIAVLRVKKKSIE